MIKIQALSQREAEEPVFRDKFRRLGVGTGTCQKKCFAFTG